MTACVFLAGGVSALDFRKTISGRGTAGVILNTENGEVAPTGGLDEQHL